MQSTPGSDRSPAQQAHNEPAKDQEYRRWLQWVFSHVDKTEPPPTPTKGLHKDDI